MKTKNVRPANIQVGAKYRHKDFSSTVYLGIGERTITENSCATEKFKNKKLVIVNQQERGFLGSIVAAPDNEGKFWDGFRKV